MSQSDPQPDQREALAARLDALSTQLDTLREDLADARAERDDLREENEALQERIADLETDVDRLEARTDLLRLIEHSDDLDGTQRATALIQHLHQGAQRRADRDQPPAATVNRDEAEEALHYPDVERTTIYKDMNRAGGLVDGDVIQYDDGELTLDLAKGDLPAKYTVRQEGESL